MNDAWQRVQELFRAGRVLATHSLTHRAVTTVIVPAHRIFAVTADDAYG